MRSLFLIFICSSTLQAHAADETTWSDALINLVTFSLKKEGALYNKFYTSISKDDEFVKKKVEEFNDLCQKMKARPMSVQQQTLDQAWLDHVAGIVEANALHDPNFKRELTEDYKFDLNKKEDLKSAVNSYLERTVPKDIAPFKHEEEKYAWSLYSFSNSVINTSLTIYPLHEDRICKHDKKLCNRFVDLRNCFSKLRVEASQRLTEKKANWQIYSYGLNPRSKAVLYAAWSYGITYPSKDKDKTPNQELQLTDRPVEDRSIYDNPSTAY